MAGGPYSTTDGWYYCKWSDKRGHPEQPQKTESLKTQKKKTASQRLSILETLRGSGYHKPWQQHWYENSQIKSIVYSGYLDLNALQSGRLTAQDITLREASETYIAFKKRQKGTRKGWKTRRTVKTHAQTIRQFVRFTGPAKRVVELQQDHLDRFYHKPGITSAHTRQGLKSRIEGFTGWCYQQGYLSEDIHAAVDPPQKTIKKYIRRDTMLAIFDKIEDLESAKTAHKHAGFVIDTTWYADFSRMNYDTGLRGIEQIQLRLGDMTPSDIIVGNSFRVKTNFQRKVAIGDGLAREVIDKYTDPEFRATDAILSNSDYLFGRSSQSTRKRISASLKTASLKAAPLTGGLTLHQLRHLSAMKWLMENHQYDEGLRTLKLMQRLGHKQLSTTQRYLNYIPSDHVI